MKEWSEIRHWRRATRAEHLSARVKLSRETQLSARSTVGALIRKHYPELRYAAIGFYWPFKGELDLRDLVRDFLKLDAEAALPVVVEKQQPIEFWSWRPRMKLSRGIWNIPIPGKRNPIQPTALLVPLVGFDAAGYRLGFGGGYYDRTLAEMTPRPLTIGIGYEAGRLETIFPQAHDIPLDAIVTEAGCTQYRYRGTPIPSPNEVEHHDYASPPCFMHELDPAYLGQLGTEEVIALMNEALESTRAGARAMAQSLRLEDDASKRPVLRDIAMNQVRFHTVLKRHVMRLGGTPSQGTAAFLEELQSLALCDVRLERLTQDQANLFKRVREVLPSIGDAGLYRDLRWLLDEKNTGSHRLHLPVVADQI